MFEADDFDEVLSQLDVPCFKSANEKSEDPQEPVLKKPKAVNISKTTEVMKEVNVNKKLDLNSVFNHSSKRTFPGPAGILQGSLPIRNLEELNHVEVISQDIEAIHSNYKFDKYASELWHRCNSEFQDYGLSEPIEISKLKNHAKMKMLRKQKAGVVVALIESIERSASDPLVRLRDESDTIKCTLHRDAWSKLSNYIIAEGTVIVLQQPTVFTTGTTHKRHYLNITLANIVALYSLDQMSHGEDEALPEEFEKRMIDNIIVISQRNNSYRDYDESENKITKTQDIESFLNLNHRCDGEDLLDGLDEASFLDEDF